MVKSKINELDAIIQITNKTIKSQIKQFKKVRKRQSNKTITIKNTPNSRNAPKKMIPKSVAIYHL